MCKELSVTRAAYYKWLSRNESTEEKENKEVARLIMEYDKKYNHILGYRRMTSWINKHTGSNYNVKRIYRIMRMLNIHSIIRKKPKKYVRSTPEVTAENIMNRDFYAQAPNLKWATDVTEFKWYEGPRVHKLYLSAIIDLYDRSVISWVLGKHNNLDLVYSTFDKAFKLYPDAMPLVHTDRGFQYTTWYFQNSLLKRGMSHSMSRVSHCLDNAPTEGFWGILKAEMYYTRTFTNEESLRKAVDSYIDFYNNERLQERFNNKAPALVRAEALGAEIIPQYPIPENKRLQKYKKLHYSCI